MTIQQQHLTELRQHLHQTVDEAMAAFEERLRNLEKDNFAAELSAPTTTVDEMPEPEPAIPDMGGIEPLVKEEAQQPPSDFQLVPDDVWEKFVKTILLAGWTFQQLIASKTAKEYDLTKDERDKLRLLETTRSKLFAKEMTLDEAVEQEGINEKEKNILTELALKNNL